MQFLPPPARLLVPVLALVAVLAAGYFALRPTPAPPLEDFSPAADPKFRSMLVDAEDADFAAYARDLGEARFTYQYIEVLRPASKGEPGAYEAVAPYLERLGRAYREIYDVRLSDHIARVLQDTPPEVLAEAQRRSRAMDVPSSDAAISDSARIRTCEDHRRFCADHGLTRYTILFDERLIRLEVGRGRREVAWKHLRTALANARRIDHYNYVCQLLGVAFQMHMEEGRLDSAMHALDLAEARARRSRAPAQTARILGFRASVARDEGRFGAAHLHMLEAWRACEEYKGGSTALRSLLNLADFYEDLQCWRAQEQVLATLRTTAGLPPPFYSAVAKAWADLRMAKLDMHAAFAHGDTTRALEVLDSISGVFGPRPYREIYARLLHDQAALLLAAGRTREAAEICQRGLAHARADRLRNWEASLQVQTAEIALARGDSLKARAGLAAWRTLDTDGVIPAESGTAALAATLDVRTATGPELLVALRRSLAAFQATASQGDAGISSYLGTGAFDQLRWTIHDLLADDPALGLDFDMRWRRVGRPGARVHCAGCLSAVGCNCPAATPTAFLTCWARPRGEEPFSSAIRRAGRDSNVAHLLYVVGPDVVWRWWSDAGGTVRRTLDLAPGELDARVAELGIAISHPQEEAGEDAGLTSLQRELGRQLLPTGRIAPGLRLLITADAALARVPFGALDIQGSGPLRPFQDDVLVAYLRRVEPGGGQIAAGPPLVVVGDTPMPDLTRRRPDLDDLPGASREGAAVALAWPGSRVLAGPAATREAVLSAMADARRLHLASHLVQDPETPFLSYIPLAANSDRIEDAMLEPRDVLAVDMKGCRLVVLSGCSSGLPYVEGTRQAPGFGDVFLDAGVPHAVQALWDVDDVFTAHIMTGFAQRTAGATTVWDMAEALSAATAIYRTGSAENRHPFAWAPWTVTTTDPGF